MVNLANPTEAEVHLPPVVRAGFSVQSQPVLLRSTEKGDEFSILMPAQPTTLVTTLRMTFKNDAVVDEDRTFAAYADRTVFLLRVLKTTNPKKTLDGILAFHEGGDRSGAKFSSQDITLGRFKGKQVDSNEVGVQYQEPYHSRTQYFAMGRKVYAISASARDSGNPWLSQFFSTLKLGEMIYDASASKEGDRTSTPNIVPAQSQNTAQTFKPEEVTRKAVLVWTPIAPFMRVPHDVNVSTGTIKLQMVLSATGEITDIKVIKGLTPTMNYRVV